MTEKDPKFTQSKYFVAKPEWHLRAGASEEDKKALEEWMNAGTNYSLIADNPDMKNPYYTWSGKVIDKG